MADIHLSLLPDKMIRLKVIQAATGTPESSMRDAIKEGKMQGVYHLGTYYSTIDEHDAWVKTSEGGGEARKAPQRPVEMPDRPPGQDDRRGGAADKGGGGQVGKGSGGGRKARRCAPGKRAIVHDIRPLLG